MVNFSYYRNHQLLEISPTRLEAFLSHMTPEELRLVDKRRLVVASFHILTCPSSYFNKPSPSPRSSLSTLSSFSWNFALSVSYMLKFDVFCVIIYTSCSRFAYVCIAPNIEVSTFQRTFLCLSFCDLSSASCHLFTKFTRIFYQFQSILNVWSHFLGRIKD